MVTFAVAVEDCSRFAVTVGIANNSNAAITIGVAAPAIHTPLLGICCFLSRPNLV
jgi:hypothetical protein